jgi:transcriptional regulator with XRE-family HTH domain
MSRRELIRDRFRQRVRDERESRDWSQAALADKLSTDKRPMHPTTVAKIEAGTRSVSIDEAARIADLFEMSIDSLVGRQVGMKGDLAHALHALHAVVSKSAWDLTGMHASIDERLTDIADFEFEGREELEVDGARAIAALSEAHRALDRMSTFELPEGAVRARDELRAKVAALEALAEWAASGGLADEKEPDEKKS